MKKRTAARLLLILALGLCATACGSGNNSPTAKPAVTSNVEKTQI